MKKRLDENDQGIFFNDRLLRLAAVPVFSLLIPPIFFSNAYHDAPGYWRSVAISFFYTLVLWEASRVVFKWAHRRWPDLADNQKRLGAIMALLVGMPPIACALLQILIAIAFPNDPNLFEPSNFQKFGSSYILMIAVGAMYEGARYFFMLKKTISEKEQLEKDHLAGQLDSLRNQVNPHFLFNSLNTLTYLIPEEPQKAVRFVQQLSKVYRYVLEHRAEKVVPLSEELDFLKSYVFLLKERFGDNLRVEIAPLDGSHQAGIVPLTLQMLFENAIKHNVVSKEKPLTVEVFAVGESLVVRNNLQKKDQVMHSTGVGLENIRHRYRLLTGAEVAVDGAGGYFSVSLPCPLCSSGSDHPMPSPKKRALP